MSEANAEAEVTHTVVHWSFRRTRAWVRETHCNGVCKCTYCREFLGGSRYGAELPADRKDAGWRFLWWRWGSNIHVLRWTGKAGKLKTEGTWGTYDR